MKKISYLLLVVFCLIIIGSPVTLAAETEVATIDTGDTAWVLISTALVFFMIPGLAFFYGGMVRSKNVLATIMQSFFLGALISVEWVLVGYTLVFGKDINGIIGDFSKLGLIGVNVNSILGTIPEFAFIAFQCMFAALTPALITGSFAGRMRFPAFVIFSLLWATLVYNPMAHWVWGGGWLSTLGALDFAGGLVIHILSGVSGLVLCIMLGKRKGYGKSPILPHHLPMAILGASMLWFGWFGFNAGSALGANGLAANAFVVSHAAAAAATLVWVAAEWLRSGKPTVLGAISGCIAGLVAITPAAGFVETMPAIVIGMISGLICYYSVAVLKVKLGYDDSLDAFGIHGIGGIWGAIATGIWATKSVNEAGANGLWYGESNLLIVQLISIGAAILLAVFGTIVIVKITSVITRLRVEEEEEILGLDLTQHGERGYAQNFISGNLVNNEDSLAMTLNLDNYKQTEIYSSSNGNDVLK